MFQQIIRLQRDIAESIELFSDFFAWSNFYSFQVPDLKKKLFLIELELMYVLTL